MRWTVVTGLRAHPWVVSAALTWWLATLLAWALLPRGRRSIWSLLFWCACGLLVAVTLTPSRDGRPPGTFPGECLPQWPRTGFGLWSPNPERRWNVLLGVPLGLTALAWPAWVWTAARRKGAGRRWSLLAPPIALAMPAVVELGQSAVPTLGRLCAVVDVVDNLSGVLLGLALAALGAAAHELYPGDHATPR